jgi:trimethylamine--corrinoid protein Co-methyltransferase
VYLKKEGAINRLNFHFKGGGIQMKLTKLEILSSEEILQIHEATLKVLSETGIHIDSSLAMKLFSEAGAQIDYKRKIIKIPKSLVEKSLDSAPRKISFYNTRSKDLAFVLGDGDIHTVSDGHEIFIWDSDVGKRRNITKSDVIQLITLADALPNIDIVLPAGQPQDVPPEATTLHGVEAVFNTTKKPLFFACEGGLDIIRAVLEMARVVSEEEDLSNHPVLICEFSPTSPLSWKPHVIEAFIEAVKTGIPCSVLPMPLSGVSAPYTLAGQLIIHNAEALSGIVLSQIVRSGTPIEYGQCPSTFDMQKTNIQFASPEAVMLRIAGTQMANFYQIPVRSAGFTPDSFILDIQNGWENMLTGFFALLSGIDLFLGLGAFGTCLTISKEKMIIDNEIFGIISRLRNGLNVSDETMATEIITEIGPGGTFIDTDHTVRHLRTGEHWEPAVTNRESYENWINKGSPDIELAAKAKADEILKTHKIEKLDTYKQKELNQIIKKYRNGA